MNTTGVQVREAAPLSPLHPGHARPGASLIRVFAIDDHPLCLRGMAAMLGTEGACHWIGEAGDTAEALRLAPGLLPDVALVDHRPPDSNGIAAIEALLPLWPATRFIVLSSHLDAGQVRRAMTAGASCVLPKTVSASDLLLAVRGVHAGQRVVPPVTAAVLDEGQREALVRNELTPRELALLELMARGLDNRAIAAGLKITVPTVKFHITNIMSKLHAGNRTAAVLAALRQRIITLSPEVAAASQASAQPG